jgi:hypothetical protein
MVLTNVHMGLVTSKRCIVPYAIHVPARALHSQSILDWIDATLVARSAHKDSGKARHDILLTENSNNEGRRMAGRQLAEMEMCGGVV